MLASAANVGVAIIILLLYLHRHMLGCFISGFRMCTARNAPIGMPRLHTLRLRRDAIDAQKQLVLGTFVLLDFATVFERDQA